jgi:HlyD family secretion protein
MSKRNIGIAVVLGVALIAAAAAMIAQGRRDDLRATTPAEAQQNDKRWLAVAPGRVEPPSGIIKVAAPTMGIVTKVLVKVNDTVFAGEPLILLNDDEIQSRYAAAEAQAGMRLRLRNEQPAPKSDERRRTEDAVAEAETAVFDAQNAVDKAAMAWRASGAPTARRWRARRTNWTNARLRPAPCWPTLRCLRRWRRRSPPPAAISRLPASTWRS